MRKRRISIGKIDFDISLGSSKADGEKKSTSTIGIELGIQGKKVSSKRLSFSNSARDIFEEAIKEATPIPIDLKKSRRRSQTFSGLDSSFFGQTLQTTNSLKELEKVITEDLPERGLQGYDLNFDSIFTKPEIKEAFRKYLRTEFNTGNKEEKKKKIFLIIFFKNLLNFYYM